MFSAHELALASGKGASAEAIVAGERRGREAGERFPLWDGPRQPVVGEVHIDVIFQGGKDRGNGATQLVVIEREVVETLALPEARGDGTRQLVA